LAIARMLAEKKYPVTVHILEFGHKGTEDFQTNLARLHHYPEVDIRFIQAEENFQELKDHEIVIDALFGSGLNRGIEGVTAKLIEHVNQSGSEIISIDIPSGLFTDHSSKGNTIIKATHSLSFQCYKPAFLVAENAAYIGDVHILDIGLHDDFYQSVHTPYEFVDDDMIHRIRKPRSRFAHKGNFGHALLVAGSYGKIGAAVLSARACLRTGAGLLTCHIPKCGYEILQSTVPEAMVMTDINPSFNTKPEDDLAKYETIGIGPGIGTASATKTMLKEILDTYHKPVILDADALNIIASQNELLKLIPAGCILSPHPKEFERLFGESLPAGEAGANDFDRIELALQKAKELNAIIILKGHHTLIATTDGKGFFNSTGNAGMAKGGTGDVLTGILTGLMAQGYSSVDSAIFGVYLHGLAGDLAVKENSIETILASDIINKLGAAFSCLNP
jgi:hydroxyethylthiazole kinase-like uncharacterized protein yjeF